MENDEGSDDERDGQAHGLVGDRGADGSALERGIAQVLRRSVIGGIASGWLMAIASLTGALAVETMATAFSAGSLAPARWPRRVR